MSLTKVKLPVSELLIVLVAIFLWRRLIHESGSILINIKAEYAEGNVNARVFPDLDTDNETLDACFKKTSLFSPNTIIP